MADIPNLELTPPINVVPTLFPFSNFGENNFSEGKSFYYCFRPKANIKNVIPNG